ncbi:unnamed protein product [Ceutorhynchus assimilis]|uniref:RanBD1 domain-containing protein n=1 Tax=Ceutorhynchus assimilis TaxID=467358 RepID=A0A9N9QIR1_9CUCU|nr:unnamed protein product [Ceutorhynchus assimilis]
MGKENEYLLKLLKEKNGTINILEGMLKERNDANRVLENRIWFLQNQEHKKTSGIIDEDNKLVDVLNQLFDNCFQTINKSINDSMQEIQNELKDIKKEQTKNGNQLQTVTDTVQEMSKELKNIKEGENIKVQLSVEDLNDSSPDYKSSLLKFPPPHQLMGTSQGFVPAVHSRAINSSIVSQPQSPKPTLPASTLKQIGFGVKPSLAVPPSEGLLQKNETLEQPVISSKAPNTCGLFGQSIYRPASTNSVASSAVTEQIVTPVENLEPVKLSPQIWSARLERPPKYENEGKEFLPAANFKPVVKKIPGSLKNKTGKENAKIKFEEHCELFSKFDNRCVEKPKWKRDHGIIGNIKIVKEDGLRLVLVPDIVKTIPFSVQTHISYYKECLNHQVPKDMSFEQISTNPREVRWDAQVFSEGIPITQTYLALFENNILASNFLTTIHHLQMSLDVKDGVASYGRSLAKYP